MPAAIVDGLAASSCRKLNSMTEKPPMIVTERLCSCSTMLGTEDHK